MDDDASDISISNLDILKDASTELNIWMGNLRTATNCKAHEKVTKEKLMRQTKEALVKYLLEGYQTMCSQSVKFESSRVCMEQIKSGLISVQRSVVKLQQQILNAQSKQLDKMSNVVDTAVDRGIRSYSQIVAQTIEDSVPALSEEKLKKVFQEAVTGE